ncbi:unnamed protein product [Brugia timori]|uniref:Uncharacterized protein n=1 Tax=Brugia timori TaxID=42155 RepID=A0A0R3QJ93_9BILA|nr:unnamed protein product [Brugia timori]
MTIFNTRSAISTTITTPESMSEESSSSLARQLSSAHAAVGEAASNNVLDSNVVFPVGSVLECRNVLNSTTDLPCTLPTFSGDTSGPGKVPLVRIVNLALVAQVYIILIFG